MKLLLWVCVAPKGVYPRVHGELLFTSREKFNSLLTNSNPDKEQLVEVEVPEDYDDPIDFIPDNY